MMQSMISRSSRRLLRAQNVQMLGNVAVPRVTAKTFCTMTASVTKMDDVGILSNTSFKVDAGQGEDVYDKWSSNYEEDCTALGFASPMACAKAAVDATIMKPGAHFLDVGCGTGWLGKLCGDLGRANCSFDGIELSGGMLEVLKQSAHGDLYKSTFKHDLSQMPWPFAKNSYDCTICNGVLIYVEIPDILDEFVRVTKKGGHCCIMFRNDGYPVFEEKDMQIRADGRWRLVEKSEPAMNFPDAPMDSPSRDVLFSIYTYEVLV